MSSPTPAAIHSLNPTFGAVLIGLLVACVLEGVLTVQAYIYFRNFKHSDPAALRYLVGVVWALDTLHLAFASCMQYEYVITHYDDQAFLLSATWTFDLDVILTSLVAFCIQSFFTWRAWTFTKSIPLTALLATLALLAFGTGLACGAETTLLVQFAKFTRFKWLVGTWLGSSAACDIVIAVSLCHALYRSKTGFKSTDGIVTRLILWTINTGLLTSIVAVADLICFTTMDNLIHFAFNLTLSKLYTNTFIATLNRRLEIRGAMSGRPGNRGMDSGESGMWLDSSAGHISSKTLGNVPTFSRIGNMPGAQVHLPRETSAYRAEIPLSPVKTLASSSALHDVNHLEVDEEFEGSHQETNRISENDRGYETASQS